MEKSATESTETRREEAETGTTENRYGWGNPWNCNATFGTNYAGLWANLRCVGGDSKRGGSASDGSGPVLRMEAIETPVNIEAVETGKEARRQQVNCGLRIWDPQVGLVPGLEGGRRAMLKAHASSLCSDIRLPTSDMEPRGAFPRGGTGLAESLTFQAGGRPQETRDASPEKSRRRLILESDPRGSTVTSFEEENEL